MCAHQHKVTMATDSLPIVDFSAFSLELSDNELDDNAVQTLSQQLHEAFSTVGFAYLKNCGISEQQLEQMRQISRQFFVLPRNIKEPYSRPKTGENHGWVDRGTERLNPKRPGDLKEAYNIMPRLSKQLWPNKEVPGFEATIMDFYERCGQLATRVLKAMALGLQLKDSDFFSTCHNFTRTSKGHTTLRSLYYLELPSETEMEANQVRCGEHTDYGSITLLFQDDVGGLEVKAKGGDYVAATPVPGTVVVNVGDMMQRWTADRLVSTPHRVLNPDSESKRREVRQSLAFFVHPEDDCLVECLDGSQKYEPITSGDYMKMRFSATYI